MKTSILNIAGLFATAALGAIPAVAQPAQAQRDRVRQVIIYGNDRCPRGTGDEIVVCARRPESERYRLPRDTTPPRPVDQNSALERDQEVREATATGIDSCSTVGPGGASGCLLQSINKSQVGKDRDSAPNPSNTQEPR
jgi:hypothetical protein